MRKAKLMIFRKITCTRCGIEIAEVRKQDEAIVGISPLCYCKDCKERLFKGIWND